MYVLILYILSYAGAIYFAGTLPAISIMLLTALIVHILYSFVIYILASLDKETKYKSHIIDLYDKIYSDDNHFQENISFYRDQILSLKQTAIRDHQEDIVIKCNKLLAKI
jgi:hypothetical protein